MVEKRGYKAIYLVNQPHAGLATFLVFNNDRFHHWSINEWILHKDEEFVQSQIDMMLHHKFGMEINE